MRIVVFCAHPDDSEFAMGGVLLKLARAHDVVNVILTRGEAGTYGTPQIREAEALEAGRRGGDRVRFLEYHDTLIEDTPKTVQHLAGIIRELEPRVIFSPYHTIDGPHTEGKAHPDHSTLGTIVRKAARIAKFVNAPIPGSAHRADSLIYYMVPTFVRPSFAIDVSDVIDELPEFWSAHASQTQLRGGALIEHLLEWRRNVGSTCNARYAESFIVETVPLIPLPAILPEP